MLHRKWTATSEGRPLTVEARLDDSLEHLVLAIDGFPSAKTPLGGRLHGQATAKTTVEGHDLLVAAVVVPGASRAQPSTVKLFASMDGLCLDTGEPHDRFLGKPAPLLPFDAGRYYSAYPRWASVSVASIIAGATFTGWAAVDAAAAGALTQGASQLLGLGCLSVITGAGWFAQDYSRQRALFQLGRPIPAIIVGVQPTRIAARVNMALPQHRPRFAVWVTEVPLRDVAGAPPRLGQRVPALVSYEDSQDGKEFQAARLVPVHLGTSDIKEIERLQADLHEQHWEALERAYERARRPSQPGRY